ncbi:hypothetical protein LSH36_1053g01004 [Paralvinella palmiformis]|uniref:UNC93-like protein n=1 Tax=Paralvinella palmiformis TaxID=53620 RepID=A0AAD9IWS2_9ANNE|nr:hypothetical protein LSH36_1053g01004 [Paralvinella palmiformis]
MVYEVSKSPSKAELAINQHSLTSDGRIDTKQEMTLKEAYEAEELTDDPQLRKRLKRKILKNVLLISLTFFMLFTAYGGLSSLQSSLHKDEGMGTITQSLLYAAMVLSCLFVPKLLISVVGHKWTIPISMSGYILWMAANGYAVWGTMASTSILVGLCAAPLWTAQCTYFTKVAPTYCMITGESSGAVVSRFFGIFFCLFQLSYLVGSIISSTILMPPGGPDENNTLSQDEVYEYCGVNDCPWNNVTNPGQTEPDDKTLWTMVGTYIAIACAGVILVCVFVDNLPKYLREDRSRAKKDAAKALIDTALHLKNKYQLLLIPITIYSGLEQGFYGAEWTRSYVSCSLGMWMVGLVGIPGSIMNAIMSFSGGHIIKFTGRLPVFTFGFLLHLSVLLTLLLWPLDIEKDYVFFILSIVWGMCDGVWQTQINDSSEAAFSNYRLWESLGFVLAFAYSNVLCTDVKLYILISALCLGISLYYTVEGMLRCRAKSGDSDADIDENKKDNFKKGVQDNGSVTMVTDAHSPETCSQKIRCSMPCSGNASDVAKQKNVFENEGVVLAEFDTYM